MTESERERGEEGLGEAAINGHKFILIVCQLLINKSVLRAPIVYTKHVLKTAEIVLSLVLKGGGRDEGEEAQLGNA